MGVLDSGPLGCSWQHGDLHLGNVYSDGEQIQLFDFGDSQWAHVLETLVIPFSILNAEHPDWWRPIRAASAEAWDLSEAQFDSLWSAARVTQAVNRASTWHSLSEGLSLDTFADWAHNAKQHLLRLAHV